MVCALIASAVSKSVYPHGVYHTLARNFMPAPEGRAGRAMGH